MAIADAFFQLDPPVQAAVITAGATCISALIGFTAVFIQIGRQGKNAIKANRQNEALKRKVEIYERTLEKSQAAREALTELTTFLRLYTSAVDIAVDLLQAVGKPDAPAARYPRYLELQMEASTAVTSLMTMIQSWLIVEPKLEIFIEALAWGSHELREARASRGRSDILMRTMPVEVLPAEHWLVPDPATAAEIRDRVEQEWFQLSRISGWIHDFQIEMQILLLDELFPNEVKRRDPPDPKQFCIRLDRYDEIKAQLAATSWSQSNAELEAELFRRYA